MKHYLNVLPHRNGFPARHEWWPFCLCINIYKSINHTGVFLMDYISHPDQNNPVHKNHFSSAGWNKSVCFSQAWMRPRVRHVGEKQAFSRGAADRLVVRPLQRPIYLCVQRQPQRGRQVCLCCLIRHCSCHWFQLLIFLSVPPPLPEKTWSLSPRLKKRSRISLSLLIR